MRSHANSRELASPSNGSKMGPALGRMQTDALRLQRSLGNRGVQQLARGAASTALPVSQPGDAREGEADAVAAHALNRLGLPPLEALHSDGAMPLTSGVRTWAQSAFKHDFDSVRVHTGASAHKLARSYEARAFTLGNEIVLGYGETGAGLLAHELAHVSLDRGQPVGVQRKTKGEAAVEKAHDDFLDPHVSVKADVDVIRAAFTEVRATKSVNFNRQAVKVKIASALKTLGKLTELAKAEAAWDRLVDDRKNSGSVGYETAARAFFARFETPVVALSRAHPKAHTHYWLRNTAPQVLDVVMSAADAALPADQLYAYAMKEGLVDYVRHETGVAPSADPSVSSLASVSTTKSISGFQFLGTDDFFSELALKKEPLTKYLPSGYDVTKLSKDSRVNEQGRTVESAIFPNLLTGLQALAAILKRRRSLFLIDAATHGYGAPTTDELMYWTYVYYNAGQYNGQLKKYKGKRGLSDWIAKGEYDNSIKLLQSWQMLRAMKLF